MKSGITSPKIILPSLICFLDTISERCHMLARHPEIGRLRPELAPDLRSFAVRNYIIFYRPIDDGIEVARVLRGSRDLDSLFE